jgi:drug/metabolite transporter (DMT)-like permease
MIGVFLVSTHGRVDQLVISPGALFWGLLSAVGLAIYTVAPVRLLKTFQYHGSHGLGTAFVRPIPLLFL